MFLNLYAVRYKDFFSFFLRQSFSFYEIYSSKKCCCFFLNDY